MNLMRGGGRRYNEFAGTNLDRLAGISDGIFSLGMTLLVLGLSLPAVTASTEGKLWHALLGLGPNVLVYTLSFMTLGIFWVGQGTQLILLERSNRNYSWLQLVFLFAVTLVPFSTAVLARFPTLRVALVEYWLNIVLLGMSLFAGLQYGRRAGLFKPAAIAETAPLMRGLNFDRPVVIRNRHRHLHRLSNLGQHHPDLPDPAELRRRTENPRPAPLLTP